MRPGNKTPILIYAPFPQYQSNPHYPFRQIWVDPPAQKPVAPPSPATVSSEAPTQRPPQTALQPLQEEVPMPKAQPVTKPEKEEIKKKLNAYKENIFKPEEYKALRNLIHHQRQAPNWEQWKSYLLGQAKNLEILVPVQQMVEQPQHQVTSPDTSPEAPRTRADSNNVPKERDDLQSVLDDYSRAQVAKDTTGALSKAIENHANDPSWITALKSEATQKGIWFTAPKGQSKSVKALYEDVLRRQKSLNLPTPDSDSEEESPLTQRSPVKWALGTMLVVGLTSAFVASAVVALMTTLAVGIATYLAVQKLNTNASEVFSKTPPSSTCPHAGTGQCAHKKVRRPAGPAPKEQPKPTGDDQKPKGDDPKTSKP